MRSEKNKKQKNSRANILRRATKKKEGQGAGTKVMLRNVGVETYALSREFEEEGGGVRDRGKAIVQITYLSCSELSAKQRRFTTRKRKSQQTRKRGHGRGDRY